jgi:hypothetical protein
MISSLGHLPPGEFVVTRQLSGQTIVIRGVVIDGVPKIGTAFTP